ncbi:MAG: tetratricopeptide repeat protein [Pseudomonadota bacterium]
MRRLDGWKAIAGYFGRDRSTVMRWAQDRELPIHRMPGGKQGSVFALENELADWALRVGVGDAPMSAPSPAPSPAPLPAPLPAIVPPAPRRIAQYWWWVLGAALVAVTLVVALSWRGEQVRAPSDVVAMPRDPRAAADYAAAKDSWARRTPRDIGRSITLYQNVVAQEPTFAPAFAGLAEAWLIFREYGEIGDLEAYNAAHVAALRALALDPNLASAHRAMGFIHYWRENDGPRAIAAFKRALALDASDAQTHFWFANVLADIGLHEAARRAYYRARVLAPGSSVIEVEAACAEWQAGRDRIALQKLADLRDRFPADATVRNCLTWVHIGQGDIAGFAREYAAMAKIRNEPALIRRAAALNDAMARDPATAHRVVVADLRRELKSGERRSRETPAFYASQMGDRELMIALMREARSAGELWYSATIIARIATRWRNDPAVLAMLRALRAPAVATSEL